MDVSYELEDKVKEICEQNAKFVILLELLRFVKKTRRFPIL